MGKREQSECSSVFLVLEGSTRDRAALSGMHIKPFSTVRVEEGGRKVKGVKIL